jgi:hypothetical protein
MSAWLLLNAFCVVFFWNSAMKDFESERPKLGWISIFISAYNAAVIADAMF